MAKFTTSLTVTTPKSTTSSQLSGDYTEVFSVNQSLDSAENMYAILKNSLAIDALTLNNCKTLFIKNSGVVGAELNILLNGWTTAVPDADTSSQFVSILLASGEFLFLPNLRMLGYSTGSSAADSSKLDNLVPHSDMYVDSVANSTDGAGTDITSSASSTKVFTNHDYFRVGDLIRVNDEIMEVTAVASGYLTVIRGTHGSTASSGHADGAAIRLPFFNAYTNFTAATGGYDTPQTDNSGRFKCFNFFGYGRNATDVASGIVAGSISGKFYSQGYQELGMSGITSSTESGLTASETYYFQINCDAVGAIELAIILSSNTKFGGSDGVIRKIQDALDVQYYTAGNLFEKRVTVSIVNGDIRFTSGSRLSTSTIALAAGSTGTAATELFNGTTGRIPPFAKIAAPVASRLPDDVIYDKRTSISTSNIGAMFYDDGNGNISGACNGTINYDSGAIDLNGCPPNAHFVVSANYGSAHAGGNRFLASDANSIMQIEARSTNPKINTTIELMALK